MTDLQIAIEQLPRSVRDNVEYVALTDVRKLESTTLATLQAIVQQWREKANQSRELSRANANACPGLAKSLWAVATERDACADQLANILPVSAQDRTIPQ